MAGVGSGLDLFGEARGGELPLGGCAVGLREGQDAEGLPQLRECAQDGGLCDLFAKLGDEIVGGERDFLGEQVVGSEGERGDFAGSGGRGGLLPGFGAAQGEDVGEGQGGDDEVGRFAASAVGVSEEIEGDGAAVGDEAREKTACLFGVGEGRRGVGGTEGGLYEGRRRRGKLRGARCVEYQAGGVEPVAEHVDGENGLGVVAPMGEAGGGELVGRGSA